MTRSRRVPRALRPFALSALVAVGCLDEDCNQGMTQIDPPNSFLDALPDVDPETWECPIESLPEGITSKCLREIFGTIVVLSDDTDQAREELDRVCMEIQETFLEPIQHSTGNDEYPPDLLKEWAKFKAVYVQRWEAMRAEALGEYTGDNTPVDVETLEAEYGCGYGPNGLTICSDEAPDFEEEVMWILHGVVEDEFPVDDESHHHQLSMVIDRDADPANNYVADPMYPFDGYQGGDLFLQALFTPAGGWTLEALEGSGLTPTMTGARLNIDGNTLTWIVPGHEITNPQALFRLWVFTHLGGWGFGEPWNGDAEPPVEEGLRELYPC